MTTDNVYDKAREVLRERGWRKGSPDPEADSAVCVLGACAVALGEEAIDWSAISHERPEVVTTLAQVIREQFPDSRQLGGSEEFVPWKWNDEDGRNAEHVDLVLDKAARQWDETHGGAR